MLQRLLGTPSIRESEMGGGGIPRCRCDLLTGVAQPGGERSGGSCHGDTGPELQESSAAFSPSSVFHATSKSWFTAVSKLIKCLHIELKKIRPYTLLCKKNNVA